MARALPDPASDLVTRDPSRPRYGIYYAPPLDSAFWSAGCQWLGRDPFSGEGLPHPGLAGLGEVDVSAITEGPRHYGFHATMKAPFELSMVHDEAALMDAVAAFASHQAPFEVPLKVQALGPFVALRPANPSEPLTALHTDCVKDFDPFRAPLSEADIARRRRAKLTPDQDAKMLKWGYPYIFESFRFHMTLTGAIRDDAVREQVCAALETYFGPHLTLPHRFDGIALYKQPDRQTPFRIVERFPFGR